MTRLRVIATALAAAGCARSAAVSSPAGTPAGASASAAAAGTRGAFVILRATDTIGVERFTRSAERLQAEFTAAGAVRLAFDAALGADATMPRLVLTTPAGGTLTFRGDSAVVTQTTGDSTLTSVKAATRGTVPYVNPSPSLMEQIVRRAHVLGGPSVTLPVYVAGGGVNQTISMTVSFRGDSARLDLAGTIVEMRVEPGGAMLGARIAAQGMTITRVVER